MTLLIQHAMNFSEVDFVILCVQVCANRARSMRATEDEEACKARLEMCTITSPIEKFV